MSLKVMCNDFANQYDTANRFGAISESHSCAIAQIERAHLGLRPNFKVLDLGIGNGEFLHNLQQFMPLAEFTGIDISTEMLDQAHEIMPLTTIETSAAEASHFLPHHSQDLVLAHFINAYIPINTLFKEAQLLARANGYFSIITTTYDAFPVAQKYLADFVAQETLLSKIVGHYYKSVVKNTTAAASEEELLQTFEKYQFQIVEHQRLYIPIKINNIDELAMFGIEGTWFVNTLAIRMLPKNFLIERLKRLFSKIFTFPYEDMHVVDVVLAKK